MAFGADRHDLDDLRLLPPLSPVCLAKMQMLDGGVR